MTDNNIIPYAVIWQFQWPRVKVLGFQSDGNAHSTPADSSDFILVPLHYRLSNPNACLSRI
jgi:hypothetical protein